MVTRHNHIIIIVVLVLSSTSSKYSLAISKPAAKVLGWDALKVTDLPLLPLLTLLSLLDSSLLILPGPWVQQADLLIREQGIIQRWRDELIVLRIDAYAHFAIHRLRKWTMAKGNLPHIDFLVLLLQVTPDAMEDVLVAFERGLAFETGEIVEDDLLDDTIVRDAEGAIGDRDRIEELEACSVVCDSVLTCDFV